MRKFARKCDVCGKLFNEGYVNELAVNMYMCSKKCRKKVFNDREWEELYNKGKGDAYYTSWEDENDYQYWENGKEIED